MGSNERFLNRVSGIEEFVRVAETLSFARAAESLGQAPSAVSKSIRHLEGRLGVRLFHRTTRSVSLTEEGAAFYERASRWTLELDEMQSAISGDPAELSGLVRLDIPTTFFRSILVPHLAAFLDRYPKVSVEVRMNDHHVNLVADAVDLALRIGPLTDSDLIVKPLGHIRMGTYARPSCLRQHGTPRTPADLSSHRLVAFLLSSGRPKPMVYTIDRTDTVIDTGHAVASFTNGDAMIDAALAGIGIAQTPAFYAKHGLAEGRLTQVIPGLDALGPPIQLVYPSRRQLPRRVRAVMGCVIDAIEDGLGDAYRKP
ncbi:LysR family transcriptional regulator [Rhizobium binxianense]